MKYYYQNDQEDIGYKTIGSKTSKILFYGSFRHAYLAYSSCDCVF
jgi:hypothetical protein